MKDKNKFNLKFLNKLYVTKKEKELKKLKFRRLELLNLIEKEKHELDQKHVELNHIYSINNELKLEFDNYEKNTIKRGIIIDIDNTAAGIKEWDNLFLKKKDNRFAITTKSNQQLYQLDNATSSLLEDIFSKGYSSSIIVIRVNNKIFKVQIRFFKIEDNETP